MLIGDITPKLMPVPQAMTVIQSPDPRVQVTPAIYQPVPYAPASEVPVSSAAVLDFSEPDLPQEIVMQSAQGPLARSEMAQQQIVAPELTPSVAVRNPIAGPGAVPAVPFMVSSRSGGMVAMAGLEGDNSGSWLALGAIALALYVAFGKK